MLLASVAQIRTTLGFEDMTDINDAITSALQAAEPVLAATLNTVFLRAEVTDTFWVPSPTVVEGRHRKTEFWLSRGFLAADPTFEIEDLDVESSVFKFDLEKGIVKDWTTYYNENYIAFTYDAGFTVDDSDDDVLSYTLSQVPSWLQEAAKMQTMINLADAAPVTEAGIKIDIVDLQRRLQAMMYTRIRYAPMALIPL